MGTLRHGPSIGADLPPQERPAESPAKGNGCGCQNTWLIPVWGVFGGCTTILRPTLVGIESDVHWGYDLDFDPWPYPKQRIQTTNWLSHGLGSSR